MKLPGGSHLKYGPNPDLVKSSRLGLGLEGIQAHTYPHANFGDLDNEIHALLKPLQLRPGWEPFLRLAAKHLQEPFFLPYWHALLCVDHVELQQHTQTIEVPMKYFVVNQTPLTAEQIAETQKALTDAPHHLFWHCGPDAAQSDDRVDYKRTVPGQCGWTVRVPKGHPTFDFDYDRYPAGSAATLDFDYDRYPAGSVATIGLDCVYAKALGPLSSLPDDAKLRVGFSLAQTILHELTHALDEIHRPLTYECGTTRDRHEPFYGEEPEAELGFVTETRFWSGWSCSIDFEYLFLLRMTKWLGIRYQTIGLSPKGLVYLGRNAPRKWTTRYFIPTPWIEKQLTKEFWETEFKENGARALKFPRQLGLRTYNVCWKKGDEEYDSDDSSVDMHEDEDFVVRDYPQPAHTRIRPFGFSTGKSKWPKVGKVLNAAYAKDYIALGPDSGEFTYQEYTEGDTEPMDQAWTFPVWFKKKGLKTVVDDDRTKDIWLDRRYFDVLETAVKARQMGADAELRDLEAENLFEEAREDADEAWRLHSLGLDAESPYAGG